MGHWLYPTLYSLPQKHHTRHAGIAPPTTAVRDTLFITVPITEALFLTAHRYTHVNNNALGYYKIMYACVCVFVSSKEDNSPG